MIISKLEITNSVNDNVTTRWRTFETEEQYQVYLAAMIKEKKDWANDPSVRSYRFYDFNKYNLEQFKELTFDELLGLSVADFIKLMYEQPI